MKKVLCIAISALLMCSVAAGLSCGPGPEPELEVEADSIAVGFADNTFIYLSRDFARFEEISDEAIRIVQSSRAVYYPWLCDDEIEAGKYGQKYVQLGFDQPLKTQGHEITTAVILLTNKSRVAVMSNVFVKVGESYEYPDSYSGSLWSEIGNLDTNGLERLVDKLR